MVSTLRLYGPEVGIDTAVVDVEVSGITKSGNIELTPQDDSFDAFTTESDDVHALMQSGLAYDKDEINTSAPIWKAIEAVEKQYEKNDDADGQAFINAAKELFRGGP